MSNILDDYMYRMTLHKHTIMEERILLVIKPAPRFIPEKLWLRLASRFLLIRTQTMHK